MHIVCLVSFQNISVLWHYLVGFSSSVTTGKLRLCSITVGLLHKYTANNMWRLRQVHNILYTNLYYMYIILCKLLVQLYIIYYFFFIPAKKLPNCNFLSFRFTGCLIHFRQNNNQHCKRISLSFRTKYSWVVNDKHQTGVYICNAGSLLHDASRR